MTVSELGERMTGEEYADWKELYRTFPFGPVRGDLQAGMIAREVRATRSKRVPKLDEMLITVDQGETQDTRNLRIKGFFQGWAAATGGGTVQEALEEE